MLDDSGEKKAAIDAVRTVNFFRVGPKEDHASPVVTGCFAHRLSAGVGLRSLALLGCRHDELVLLDC